MFLSSSIQAFLTRHGFVSLPSEQRHRNSPSPRKRRKTDFEGDSGYGEQIEGHQSHARPQAHSIATNPPMGVYLSEAVRATLPFILP